MSEAVVTLHRDIRAPAGVVWRALTDWPAHGRWVPGTTVRITSPHAGGVGATFVARTGIGPLGFDDSMTITEWQEPSPEKSGRCVVVKTGRVVHGGAEFEVVDHGSLSTVRWTERVEVVALRRLPGAAAVSRAATRLVFGRVIRLLATELESPPE
ncbi:MAG: SRPBCC family protein [Actinomycetota bacterium]